MPKGGMRGDINPRHMQQVGSLSFGVAWEASVSANRVPCLISCSYGGAVTCSFGSRPVPLCICWLWEWNKQAYARLHAALAGQRKLNTGTLDSQSKHRPEGPFAWE
jgi:hypothetical protein